MTYLPDTRRRLGKIFSFFLFSSSISFCTQSPLLRAVPAVQQVGTVVYSSATIGHDLANVSDLYFIQMVGLKGALVKTTSTALTASFRLRLIQKHPFSVRVNRSAVSHAAVTATVFIIGKQSWFSTWLTGVTGDGGTARLGTCAGGPVLDINMGTGDEATACTHLGEFFTSLRNATIADGDFTTHYALMSTQGRAGTGSLQPPAAAQAFFTAFGMDKFVAFSTTQTTPIPIIGCPEYFLHLTQANLTASLGQSALDKWQNDCAGHFVAIGNYTPADMAGFLINLLSRAILESTPGINQNLAGSACNSIRGDIATTNGSNTEMVPVGVFDCGPADAIGLAAAAVLKMKFSDAAQNLAGAVFETKWNVIGGRALFCVQLKDGGPTFLTGKNRYGALLDTAANAKTTYSNQATMRSKLFSDWVAAVGSQQADRRPGGNDGLASNQDGYLDWFTCMMGAEQSTKAAITKASASTTQTDKDDFADDVADRIGAALLESRTGTNPNAGLFNVYNFIGSGS
ncbi:hypothetical protein [Candidatus Similichlamydia laticola]|uniref:Uncharacterized protein n=1 Tax=Candidatus Similichlamydia laticola TaxID=2170265 RepID=A0A369K9N4_9BACT|nr:hypothetical protein [Candidatus Similichlamydia laticola]RDB31301.1 hypothetical protein HAT2_00596 [Candidatus Similichlamydia laticola]